MAPGNQDETLWHEVAAAMAARESLVVATVVRDRGSVPRRSGAKMLVPIEFGLRPVMVTPPFWPRSGKKFSAAT